MPTGESLAPLRSRFFLSIDNGFWSGGNRTLSEEDVLTVTHGSDSVVLVQESDQGVITGVLDGERTGDFILSLDREGHDSAPNTVVSLPDPVLASHVDGGDVLESDGVLEIELEDFSAEIVSHRSTLLVDCGEGGTFESSTEADAFQEQDTASADPSMLVWELSEVYSSLSLSGSTECAVELKLAAAGSVDPALHRLSRSDEPTAYVDRGFVLHFGVE